MDQEAHLAPLLLSVERFSKITSEPAPLAARSRAARRFIAQDAMERAVTETLLFETAASALKKLPVPQGRALAFFLDRGGHGGAHAAPGLFALLSAHFSLGLNLHHASFNTPPSGLGVLVRNAVIKAAEKHGIEARVSLCDVSPECMQVSQDEIDTLFRDAALVISYAAAGEAGLIPSDRTSVSDRFSAGSHAAVLSFLDPEALVGELAGFESRLLHEPQLSGLRFRAQIYVDAGTPPEDVADTVFRPDTARETTRALGRLLESTRRMKYLVRMEPIRRTPCAEDEILLCPCRELLMTPGFLPSLKPLKAVPAGACNIVAAEGIHALFAGRDKEA